MYIPITLVTTAKYFTEHYVKHDSAHFGQFAHLLIPTLPKVMKLLYLEFQYLQILHIQFIYGTTSKTNEPEQKSVQVEVFKWIKLVTTNL